MNYNIVKGYKYTIKDIMDSLAYSIKHNCDKEKRLPKNKKKGKRRVYIVAITPERKAVKIGTSSDIPSRMKTLKCERRKPSLARSLTVVGDETLEKAMHHLFRDRKLSGEWFYIDEMVAYTLLKEMASIYLEVTDGRGSID